MAVAASNSITATIDKINALAKDAKSSSALVGYPDEGTLVVALANSYGTDTIPARGFIQRGAAKARDQSVEVGLDVPIANVLRKAAENYRAALVDAVNTAGSWAPPLDDDTLERHDDATVLGGRLSNIQVEVLTNG